MVLVKGVVCIAKVKVIWPQAGGTEERNLKNCLPLFRDLPLYPLLRSESSLISTSFKGLSSSSCSSFSS